MEKKHLGKIFRIESKDYYVWDANGNEIRCNLPGKFKNELRIKKNKLFTLDYVVVGDDVEFVRNNDGSGVIKKVCERKNCLSRKALKSRAVLNRGERVEQIIASNVNNLFIIASILEPPINNRIIDRIIVAGESNKINVNIVINKIDLLKQKEQVEFWKNFYENIGYSVFITSAIKGIGIENIKNKTQDSVNIFWGPSGVGKSSLLNAMFALDLKVNEISQYSQKGVHTTVTCSMIKINKDTFVIDTPGIREIAPYGIKKEDLGYYFKEFIPFIKNCRFNTCTHSDEPDCAIVEAVENNFINLLRYESYINILNTIEQDMYF
ncbi:MAG: ribosome small subunit-dependent GTPase A [Ignavibacteriales bacterium]|nr:ribosome small subunit-dependent GTPase A [Ignavibacteriales bacterium]